MADLDTLFKIADLAVSLAVLIAVVVGFVRGDILSRRSISAVVGQTVREVLKEIRRQ